MCQSHEKLWTIHINFHAWDMDLWIVGPCQTLDLGKCLLPWNSHNNNNIDPEKIGNVQHILSLTIVECGCGSATGSQVLVDARDLLWMKEGSSPVGLCIFGWRLSSRAPVWDLNRHADKQFESYCRGGINKSQRKHKLTAATRFLSACYLNFLRAMHFLDSFSNHILSQHGI